MENFLKGDTISAYYKNANVFNNNYKDEYKGFYRLKTEHGRLSFIEMLCKYRSNRLDIFRVSSHRIISTTRIVLVEKTLNLLF